MINRQDRSPRKTKWDEMNKKKKKKKKTTKWNEATKQSTSHGLDIQIINIYWRNNIFKFILMINGNRVIVGWRERNTKKTTNNNKNNNDDLNNNTVWCVAVSVSIGSHNRALSICVSFASVYRLSLFVVSEYISYLLLFSVRSSLFKHCLIARSNCFEWYSNRCCASVDELTSVRVSWNRTGKQKENNNVRSEYIAPVNRKGNEKKKDRKWTNYGNKIV